MTGQIAHTFCNKFVRENNKYDLGLEFLGMMDGKISNWNIDIAKKLNVHVDACMAG